MKETIEKELQSICPSDLLRIECEMQEDGWQLKSTRCVTILTFERKIPDPPPLPKNCNHPECPLCDGIKVVCKHQSPTEQNHSWNYCHCDCHINPDKHHCIPCCETCPLCDEHIMYGGMPAHLKSHQLQPSEGETQ